MFGFLESLYERDWDSWGPYPDSNPKPLNAPNQQLTITWNLMAIHFLVVGYQLDDESNSFCRKWLEISKNEPILVECTFVSKT